MQRNRSEDVQKKWTNSFLSDLFPPLFSQVNGGIAQLVERLVRNEKARGSNPLTSSLRFEGRKAEAVTPE